MSEILIRVSGIRGDIPQDFLDAFGKIREELNELLSQSEFGKDTTVRLPVRNEADDQGIFEFESSSEKNSEIRYLLGNPKVESIIYRNLKDLVNKEKIRFSKGPWRQEIEASPEALEMMEKV